MFKVAGRTMSFFIPWLILVGTFAHALEQRDMTYYVDKLTDYQRQVFTKKGFPIESKAEMKKAMQTPEGMKTYFEAKAEAYQTFFKDWRYLQHLHHADKVYALYFTVMGFDDVSFHVIEFSKNTWREQETLPQKKQGEGIRELFWNYDEGDKNIDDLKLFIEHELLVLSRGGLYHSLYDLSEHKVLINEESPWHVAKQAEEDMNAWIKTHLHDEIEAVLSTRDAGK